MALIYQKRKTKISPATLFTIQHSNQWPFQEAPVISQQLASLADRARAPQAFLYWPKHSATPAEQAAWDNKDLGVKDKQALLSKWLVHKARNFSTELSCTTTQELVVATSAAENDSWWGAERMGSELGANRAKGMRGSNLLQTRPCRVTGSTEDHIRT